VAVGSIGEPTAPMGSFYDPPLRLPFPRVV
jgi:hypothetical protein